MQKSGGCGFYYYQTLIQLCLDIGISIDSGWMMGNNFDADEFGKSCIGVADLGDGDWFVDEGRCARRVPVDTEIENHVGWWGKSVYIMGGGGDIGLYFTKWIRRQRQHLKQFNSVVPCWHSKVFGWRRSCDMTGGCLLFGFGEGARRSRRRWWFALVMKVIITLLLATTLISAAFMYLYSAIPSVYLI